MYVIRVKGKYGFLDLFKREIAPPIYDDVYDFDEENLALVVLDGKRGYINKDGLQYWED